MAIRIHFADFNEFSPDKFKNLSGVVGIYFIFLTKKYISYPFKNSHLIYIGMSEKRSNSIAARLENHYSGESENKGLTNYRLTERLRFTYINFEALKSVWLSSVEDLESYFITDFVKVHGVYPICNNRTGEIKQDIVNVSKLDINWAYFQRDMI